MSGSTPEARVLVIAEAGVNHDGDLDRARRLVDAAAAAGADAVKFQTFDAARLAGDDASKAPYQAAATGAGSQRAMLAALALDRDAHLALVRRCRDAGIEFMSSPFDAGSADFLARQANVARLKIPSGALTDAPFLLHVAGLGLPVILSTGAADLNEVRDALGVLALGYARPGSAPPTGRPWSEIFARHRDALHDRVTVLHCVTAYPAPVAQTNLRAMATMAEAFGLPVGLSDHSPGVVAAVAAVALGARVIEKHLTLDRSLPGPDHAASLEPESFAALVGAVREAESALGDGVKRPAACELENRDLVRTSLVAARAIGRGEAFSPANLASRRPGYGLSPFAYWQLLGRRAERDYAPGERIAQ